MNFITANIQLLKKFIIILVLAGILPVAFFAVKNDIPDYLFSEESNSVNAKVLDIIDKSSETVDLGNGALYVNEDIIFSAVITSGKDKNETITALQNRNNYVFTTFKEVSSGDKVLIANVEEEWYLVDYVRISKLYILGLIFVIGILFFGKAKGLNTLISLVLTLCAVFMVFIPAVLAGMNIYICSILVCIYVTVMTLLIISDSHKSLAAGCGCLGGIVITAIIVAIMDKVLMLTGMVDENSHYLTYLNPDKPIDLNGIIFASIVIGALGAVMDVAMSIASSLWEVNIKGKDLTFKSLVQSGLAVGRDVMGTMANTLVLAYMGSSLSVVLLLVSYSSSLNELLNRELIIVEILKALAGSIGILITMPITAVIASALYVRNRKTEEPEEDFDEEKAIEDFWSRE